VSSIDANHYTPEVLLDPRNWRYPSTDEPGIQLVVSPYNSACIATWAYRLNLNAGESFTLNHSELELNGAVIKGKVSVEHGGDGSSALNKLDSFYLPGGDEAKIQARDAAVLYIGGAEYHGVGTFFVRRYEPDLPLGEIHQIHGQPPYEREVFMTVNQEVDASRLIDGFTWGADGMWTSWPPHQHSADLEEVYCYFDLTPPSFALHLSSREAGTVEAVHPVSTGDFVLVPEGYHPTVSSPGSRSSYFWIMAAHSAESRRYDLAKSDFTA
jgi:5-deoxy-glucuronate isomerase